MHTIHPPTPNKSSVIPGHSCDYVGAQSTVSKYASGDMHGMACCQECHVWLLDSGSADLMWIADASISDGSIADASTSQAGATGLAVGCLFDEKAKYDDLEKINAKTAMSSLERCSTVCCHTHSMGHSSGVAFHCSSWASHRVCGIALNL